MHLNLNLNALALKLKSKGNDKQDEKTTLIVWENNRKWKIDKGLISKHTSSSYNSILGKQTTQSKSGKKT